MSFDAAKFKVEHPTLRKERVEGYTQEKQTIGDKGDLHRRLHQASHELYSSGREHIIHLKLGDVFLRDFICCIANPLHNHVEESRCITAICLGFLGDSPHLSIPSLMGAVSICSSRDREVYSIRDGVNRAMGRLQSPENCVMLEMPSYGTFNAEQMSMRVAREWLRRKQNEVLASQHRASFDGSPNNAIVGYDARMKPRSSDLVINHLAGLFYPAVNS